MVLLHFDQYFTLQQWIDLNSFGHSAKATLEEQ